jgi:hypothetical protein
MPAKKTCFGDDAYFNETSRGCIRCPHFDDCRVVVQANVNRVAMRGSTWGTTSASSVKRTLSPTTTGRSKAPAVVRSLSRDSVYNFDAPVLPQLARYAGFSVAEVCLEELHTLVTQARDNYIEETLTPKVIDITPAEAKDKPAPIVRKK